jgi:hypothetical protein
MCLIQIKHTQIKIPLCSFWTVHVQRYSKNLCTSRLISERSPKVLCTLVAVFLVPDRLHPSPGSHKRCRLSWLTNSALVYEPICGVSSNEYSCAHGAQINFGDPTPI